ncbi:MAG TPA: diguanylate cyclase [Mesotoga infera]|nr:diguanylate cyclase [Mesotoga infera]
MRSRLTPFLVAALSALLMLIVILIMLENRAIKTEKQLAGSTRLFVDETVKAVLIGYFHRDCILKSIEEGDIESVSHNLEYLMEDNAPMSGVRVVIDGTPFIELGDIITHNDTVAVKGDMPYTIFYDEGFLLAATAISDGRGAQNADDSYALIAIKLSSIIDLLTDERYVLSEKANTKIYGSLGIRLARDINMGNAFSLVFAFVISYLFMVFIQTKTEKGFVVAKNREQAFLLNSMPSMIWCLKDSRTFGMVNSQFARFFGKRPEEIENHVIEDVLPSSEVESCIESNEEVIRSKAPVSFKQSSTNHAGEKRTIAITKIPVTSESGEVDSIICTAEDVTDKEVAESRLRLIQFALDNVNEEAFWISKEGDILYVNKATCKALGYSQDELVGMKVHDVDPTELAKNRDLNWEQVKKSRQDVIETFHRRKDGTIFPVEVNRNYLIYEGQEYEFSFARDISERRSAQNRLEREKRRIERLHETALAMERCREKREVFELIIQASRSILDFDICFVAIVENDHFSIKISSNLSPEDPMTMPLNVGIVGKTYREKKSFVLEDIQESEQAFRTNNEYHGGLSVPVGNIGVFQAMSMEKNAFTDEDVKLAELLMLHASEAIKRIETEQEMAYMSLHDRLTGLYNRVYFEEEIQRLNYSRLYPISIISADIDGLKLINDTMGHSTGDDLLRSFAEILKANMRSSDVVSRFGGDEFAAILVSTDRPTAERVIERIRKAVARYNESRSGPFLSFSMGVATSNNGESSLLDCLKLADDLMYRDKLSRSNSVRSQMVNTLLLTLAEKDHISGGHASRLQEMAIKLGKRMGLNSDQLVDLSLFAQVHDLGKVGIPDRILFKPGKLTEEEWGIMKLHPEKGYRIAVSSPDLSTVADLILRHHERWDGKGYPLGLERTEIPIECRILSIVDAYDAMTNDRPYCKARSHSEALKEIERCAGTQFDPKIVEEFLKMLQESPRLQGSVPSENS